MLTIKDILHIPYPEEQKELKPGYTILDIQTGKKFLLNADNFGQNHIRSSIDLDGYIFTIDGRISEINVYPQLIVIGMPKIPKKIRLAPALLKSQNIYKSQRLYESFEDAKLNNKDTSVIWPAPPIGSDGFYEFSEDDWQ